jgi:ubiquinone/menaquinone biosynthesis C-methylase UbiE
VSDQETVRAFDSDVDSHAGYVYTTSKQLSCRLAIARWVETVNAMVEMKDRRVLDLGCGDGYFSRLYHDRERPAGMVGIDPSANAIAAAIDKRGERQIEYKVGDGHALPYADREFDLVLVQAVLHHDNNAGDIVREACRLGREVVILEPNGYNPGLKILEKISPYHRQHKEKSYFPRTIDSWLERAGARIVDRRYSNFVPMFAPDLVARACRRVEPLVEGVPLVRNLGCAIYTVKALVG